MNILCWNCQGIGNPWTVQGLKGMLSLTIPKLVFLCETKCTADEMVRVRRQLGFKKSFAVDCRFVPTKHDKGIRRAGGVVFAVG